MGKVINARSRFTAKQIFDALAVCQVNAQREYMKHIILITRRIESSIISNPPGDNQHGDSDGGSEHGV